MCISHIYLFKVKKKTFLLVHLAAPKLLQKDEKNFTPLATNLGDKLEVVWYQNVRNSIKISVGWLVFQTFT